MGIIDSPVTLDRSLTGNGDNSIGIFLPKDIMDSSILVHSSSWLVSFFMYGLNTLAYYVVGWMISAGFYRFGWFIGLGFIVLSFVFITTGDLLWGTELDEPLSHWLPFDSISLPLYGSFIGTIMIVGVMLWLIRMFTRDVTIKM
ncbi:hypothetical protein SAMN04488072_11050 [Lentibacillus halodurans]|uniref:Uncharacterized protein n=1 Tax=Lentibacillus halodurans TaxID=237679 RepID=A0A1I0Z854_9BACI|nr:hypothetical protein [Lentibacillus halodurans]SFB21929.1 hypothetical protein SAMN04488072_11050 [Lentibacillus halodurans]